MMQTLKALSRRIMSPVPPAADVTVRDDVLANAQSEAQTGWVRFLLVFGCAFAIADLWSASVAFAWCASALAIEIANRFACVRVLLGRKYARDFFLGTSIAVSAVWTALGALLWFGGGHAGQIAAVLSLSVTALYAIAYCYYSPRFLIAVASWPLALMSVLLFLAASQAPAGAPAVMLALVTITSLATLIIAGAGTHLAYARLWKARAKLAEERDALEQRVAERTRELADAVKAAEAANIAKSQFLANMSHELRTPLNAVIGYAEMLEEDLEAEGAPSLTGDARRIANSGRHLMKLINDVLDISKIEANRMDLDCEFVDLARLLRDVTDSARLIATEKHNQLDVKVAPELAPIWADGLRLHQCALNLVSNACKFTSNGIVSVNVERVGDQVHVSVRDTGIGIAADNLDKLFQPFVQADLTTTRNFGGTGLGLSITRKLARLMKGDVTVESQEGVGSTFTIVLPYVTEASPSANAAEQNEGDASPATDTDSALNAA